MERVIPKLEIKILLHNQKQPNIPLCISLCVFSIVLDRNTRTSVGHRILRHLLLMKFVECWIRVDISAVIAPMTRSY
jgi:hypothetical protein